MSIQRGDILSHVTRILGEEGGLLVEFEGLLHNELAILRGSDVAAVERIGSTRHRCVDALTRLEAERSDLCKMLSYGTGRAAFERLLAWCDPGDSLTPRWRDNLEIARRCKALNDQNGALVAAKLGQVRKMLMSLRGSVPPPVYNARGSRYGALERKDFGSA